MAGSNIKPDYGGLEVNIIKRNELQREFRPTKLQIGIDVTTDYICWPILSSVAGTLCGIICRTGYTFQNLTEIAANGFSKDEPSYAINGLIIGVGAGLLIATAKTAYRITNYVKEGKRIAYDKEGIDKAVEYFKGKQKGLTLKNLIVKQDYLDSK